MQMFTTIPQTLEHINSLEFSQYNADDLLNYLLSVLQAPFEVDREVIRQTREVIKTECLTRIQQMLAGEINAENIHDLLVLVKTYAGSIAGFVTKEGFNGPAHIFKNEELLSYVTEFFAPGNEVNHNMNNSAVMADYLYLFQKRICEAN